jgi:hypothetical protein
MTNLVKDSRCPGRDLNGGLPEYKFEVVFALADLLAA